MSAYLRGSSGPLFVCLFISQLFQLEAASGRVVVSIENAPDGSALQVLITSAEDPATSERAWVLNGTPVEVTWRGAGPCDVRVLNERGQVLLMDRFHTTQSGANVQLRLPPQRQEPRTEAGTISASRLIHKVPREARREYERGWSSARKGRDDEAVAHFEKAVSLDPEYFEAHNDLGARYLRVRRLSDAQAEFETALRLDAESPHARTNLGLCFLFQGRIEEAEREARQALKHQPINAQASYVIGASLLMSNRLSPEIRDRLEDAADSIESAHVGLAVYFARKGELQAAADRLRNYLPAAKDPQTRQQALQLLPQIEAKLKQSGDAR